MLHERKLRRISRRQRPASRDVAGVRRGVKTMGVVGLGRRPPQQQATPAPRKRPSARRCRFPSRHRPLLGTRSPAASAVQDRMGSRWLPRGAARLTAQPDPDRSPTARKTSIREGLLPPQVVFGQRTFLLPCHGVPLAATSLSTCMQGPRPYGDGQWSVFADYTQGLLARARPWRTASSPRGSCRPISIACTSSGWRGSSSRFATRCNRSPGGSDNPRVVLLSAGPRGTGHFEDAYLARYLATRSSKVAT